MSSVPDILFVGPGLAGVREFAERLGWLSDMSAPVHPRDVTWRGQPLRLNLGHRGPLWIPELASPEWRTVVDEKRRRVRDAREASLKTANGILFVADSQSARHEANLEHLERLGRDLETVGRRKTDVVMVFAMNKQDLCGHGELTASDVLRETLTWPDGEHVETSARTGIGTAAAIDQLVLLLESRK